jgi:radical SAM superfamily enzyme YgiQ (UPF0313 family)
VKILLASLCLETGTDIQLALYYLKSYCTRHWHADHPCPEITIRTFNEDQNISCIAQAIVRRKPRVVGFSCYLWNIEKTLRICGILKKTAPRTVIVLGGPEATPRAEELLNKENAIDIVVKGEGERAFAECVHRIDRGRYDLSGVEGVSFRHKGRVICNPARPQIGILNVIPSPYLSGLVDLADKNIVDVPVETARGCSYRCGYCYYHKNFPCVRFFPLARVEQELKRILSRKPREVYLMDATFNAYPHRAKKILRLFIKHNRGSNLHIEVRAEFIDDEMAALLRKAQANNIEIGIQSTNPGTLKAVNRPFDKNRFRAGIQLLNKYGLLYEIQLIDALPYQRYSDLKRALDWLYGLHPVKVVVFPLSILPGTALRQAAGRYRIGYRRQAPYYAYKSNAMSCAEVRRVERLRFAMERLYDSQVFQKTLYALRDKAGIKISDIFEDWIDWQGRLPGAGRITPEGYNKRLPDFLKYVLRKRRKKGVRHN